MKNFLNKLFKNHTILTIISVSILIMSFLILFKLLTTTRIYVEFKDLRPFHEKAPVYFKGYKIGKVVKIQPIDNYQSTLVTILLHPKNLNLPLNTTAKLKVHKTRWFHKDYIDLIYPDSPDLAKLKTGSKITGKSSIDIHSYLSNISPDSYEKMEENAANILANLDDTTGMLYSVFAIINSILTDNETNIKKALNNFEKTTNNTQSIMSKIDNSINQEKLTNTFDNINSSSIHAQNLLQVFGETTSHLNKTIPNINTTIENSRCLISNLNAITGGIKNTMCKRFTGLRLIFGKPIKNCNCK